MVLVASAALFTSCIGRPGLDGRDGRDGIDGIDGVGTIRTVVINVDESLWEYSNDKDNNYFFATVDMPEITLTAFREGLVKMYRVFDFSGQKLGATQMEMPYTRHNEYKWGTAPDERALYTETVDYEYSVGSISIFYTASDFDYEYDLKFQPETMQFRCIIMY